jgi:hypothetical protein
MYAISLGARACGNMQNKERHRAAGKRVREREREREAKSTASGIREALALAQTRLVYCYLSRAPSICENSD